MVRLCEMIPLPKFDFAGCAFIVSVFASMNIRLIDSKAATLKPRPRAIHSLFS